MVVIEELRAALAGLRLRKLREWSRHVSTGDLLTDRSVTAGEYGFGEGSSCYDNVLIIGDVKVGRNTWIGPGCVLDGSGGLEIGDFCSISAGVQIYSHHTVRWATSMGSAAVERRRTVIGSGVYIGPNAVVQMGVVIGNRAVIGALAFVSRDVPVGARAWGVPARVVV